MLHKRSHLLTVTKKKPRSTHKGLPFGKRRFMEVGGVAGESFRRMGQKQEKDQAESATGLDRRTREEIYRRVRMNLQP